MLMEIKGIGHQQTWPSDYDHTQSDQCHKRKGRQIPTSVIRQIVNLKHIIKSIFVSSGMLLQ